MIPRWKSRRSRSGSLRIWKQRSIWRRRFAERAAEHDRAGALEAARRFVALGFTLKATTGTQRYLQEQGVSAERIYKIHEGSPNIADAIENKEIQLVVNIPSGKLRATDDSYIRKTAIRCKVPYITTAAAALAAARGIEAYREGRGAVRSLQSYHAGIG